jgi:hypothetical protein
VAGEDKPVACWEWRAVKGYGRARSHQIAQRRP